MVQIPAGFVQVTYNFLAPTASGKAAWVLGAANGNPGTLAAVAQIFVDHWNTELAGIQHTSFTLDTVRVITETEEGEASGGGATGGRSGDLAPPNTCALATKVNPLRGPKFQGRSFMAGYLLDSDIFDDGSINATAISNINAGLFTWQAKLIADSLDLVILHNDSTAPTPVDDFTVQARAATQRRRLRR